MQTRRGRWTVEMLPRSWGSSVPPGWAGHHSLELCERNEVLVTMIIVTNRITVSRRKMENPRRQTSPKDNPNKNCDERQGSDAFIPTTPLSESVLSSWRIHGPQREYPASRRYSPNPYWHISFGRGRTRCQTN